MQKALFHPVSAQQPNPQCAAAEQRGNANGELTYRSRHLRFNREETHNTIFRETFFCKHTLSKKRRYTALLSVKLTA